MVFVAQLVEPMIVNHAVAGSSPVVHPKFSLTWMLAEKTVLSNESIG
jgi:hypothetical protein